jgi:hypothetical protein
VWYRSSTAAVSAWASASRKGPLGPARSGKLVERKEASGCEKRVSTSGAFRTGWGRGRRGLNRELAGIWLEEGETNLEGVVEDEYDYAVCL